MRCALQGRCGVQIRGRLYVDLLRDVFHMDSWLYVFMICCCVKVSRVQNTDTECRSINQRSEFDILMAKVVAGVNRSSVFSIDL